jgi:hypothetical protein
MFGSTGRFAIPLTRIESKIRLNESITWGGFTGFGRIILDGISEIVDIDSANLSPVGGTAEWTTEVRLQRMSKAFIYY